MVLLNASTKINQAVHGTYTYDISPTKKSITQQFSDLLLCYFHGYNIGGYFNMLFTNKNLVHDLQIAYCVHTFLLETKGSN